MATVHLAYAETDPFPRSTISAWLVDWILSTRPNSQGTVAANTYPQLQSKT
jgi:hypothetical protein